MKIHYLIPAVVIVLLSLVSLLSLKAARQLPTASIMNSTGGEMTREMKRFQALVDGLVPSFETNVSTTASVTQYGFPTKWKPCTLRHLSVQDHNIQITVVGGSSTAHSARNCDQSGTDVGGRYTNILQKELDRDLGNSSIAINVVNVGHGATDTLWNALMLDELINASTTDVLIWEYATNDALGGSTGMPARTPELLREMLNLWLWRVAQIFSEFGRPPPPLILVYLWDANFVVGNFRIVGQSAFRWQIDVVEFYRQQGWSIEVVNVGGVVNSTLIAEDNSQLLDDAHHPCCAGMKLISAMIRQTLYSDMATCAVRAPPTKKKQTPLIPMPYQNRTHLLMSLLNTSAKIGSMMEWQPQAGSSSLRINNSANMSASVHASVGTKAVSWRADRKLSYTLPSCPVQLQFTLYEPKLDFVGIGYGGGYYAFHTYSGNVEVTINGVLLNSSSTDAGGGLGLESRFVHKWVDLSREIPPADTYAISFCKAVSPESRCVFENATSVAEACQIWSTSHNISSCPYAEAPDVLAACNEWSLSPEGQAIQKKYGSWVGDWGRGNPQINWIIGVTQRS